MTGHDAAIKLTLQAQILLFAEGNTTLWGQKLK
jgi:hypothetical protein